MQYIQVTDFYLENAKFSRICEENGIKFIGASPEMIDGMGDKASAKTTMEKAGVPVVPGSPGLLKDLDDAIATAKKVVYPVMIKATAGGGGKGMRVVWNEDEMEEHWNLLDKNLLLLLEMMGCIWKNTLKNLVILRFKLQVMLLEMLATSQKEIVQSKEDIKN